MRRFKKIAIVLIVFSAVTGGVTAFFVLNSKPDELSKGQKEQAIGQILGRKPNLNPQVKTGNVTYGGKYASFSYPGRAKIYEYKNRSGANSESFSFDIDSPRLILNYSAARSDLKISSDVPSVRLRQDLSNGYAESKIKADGQEGIVFSKKESSGVRAEKTGFFLVNATLYTISITGNNLEDVTKMFDQIVKTLKFNL